jgi:hypothetical protein
MKERTQVIRRKCVGFRDSCDYCIEKGIQCKEFVKGSQSKSAEENNSKNAVADGTMDVIDGLKAARAFATCERCLEEKVQCDESLPSCGGCAEKDVECRYRLLSTTFFGELSQLYYISSLTSDQTFQEGGRRKGWAPCLKSIERAPRKAKWTSSEQGFQQHASHAVNHE